jgi:hypothetical protein
MRLKRAGISEVLNMYHAVWYKQAERAMDELSVVENQVEERSVQKSNNEAWTVVLLST